MNPADGPFSGMLLSLMAVKRYAHADEIAALALFLAGPNAALITGTTHTIDGGPGI